MALIKSSAAPKPVDNDDIDLFIQKDNVENISEKFRSELNALKSGVDITDKNLQSIANNPDSLLKKLDVYAEEYFDGWVVNNKAWIKEQIANNNSDAIQKSFNERALPLFNNYIDEIKTWEIQALLDYDFFQLQALQLDALKSSIGSGFIPAPAGGGIFKDGSSTSSRTNGNNIGGNNNTSNANTNSSTYAENTNVYHHGKNNPDGTLEIGTTSFGIKSTETGHNEYELAHNGTSDGLYTGFAYADSFLSKRQEKRNKKSGDKFDPTSDQKYTYKNKEIEYRDKNKQVYTAVTTIMKDFTKIDKHGDEGELALRDVRGLDRTKVPDILYLITRDDKMKEHNALYDTYEKTGSDLSKRKAFVNDTNDGIHITPEKEKEFKKLVKGIDYTGVRFKKLIAFLNLFNDAESIPYINKLIDIGARKGKSGRMQLIETSNVSKLIDHVSVTEVDVDKDTPDDKNIFLGSRWKIETERLRGDKMAEKTALSTKIEAVERTGNFFSFVCDLNNDGRVDQYDLGSSITGFAFHGMLMSVCDVKKDSDAFEIVNGPKTANVLKNMLEKAYSVSHNVNLRADIKSLLDNNNFLHTYHVFELIKKYPEIKPFMIYDIQAETEYAQSTRQIQHTYEAFNPESADSLAQNDGSDFIDDYFTNEAIKNALGDLDDTYINKLKDIATREGITLNRNVNVDTIRAVNMVVSTLFMNFGPLMRAMQYDRLQSGHNDPGYTGQYNPGNAHLAIEGKIPLSKEDLERPWNGQERKEFITSTGFKKRLKTTSITPMLGVSTYSDSKGKIQPSPVLGVGVSFDKTKIDPSGKWAQHFTQIGVAYDVMDMQLFAGLNGSNVRQVNNKKLKDDFDTNKPYAKGLGTQYSVGGALDIQNPLQSGLFASVGPLYQIDHLAGLDQVSKNFETFLSPFISAIDANFFASTPTGKAGRDKLYIQLETYYLGKFPTKYKESKYLHLTEGMIHMFVGRIQQHKVLENLNKHDLPISDKQKILQAYMGQRADGFVSTLYQAELARLNARGLKLSKIGAKIGANLTVESLLHGGPIGVLFSMNLSFSAHNEVYGDDPHDINSVSKQLDYGAGMESLDILPGTNISDIARTLENAFTIPGLSIRANTKTNTLSLSNENGGSVLDLLHLYYTQDALKNAGFSFDGEVLTIGDVGAIGIANIFKGMTKSHYLILGSDKMIGCMEHKPAKVTPGNKKGEKATATWDALQPKDANGDSVKIDKVAGFEQKIVDVLPTIAIIQKQVKGLSVDAQTDILPYLHSVSRQGNLILTIPSVDRPILHNIKEKNGEYFIPSTGTLSFMKDMQGNLSLTYTSTPSDKLIINHKQQLSEVSTGNIIARAEKIQLSLDISDIFKDARVVLDTNRAEIKSFDNSNRNIFFEFLSKAKNTAGGGIDKTDYAAALAAIRPSLTKHVNNIAFSTLLESAKDEELVYIVNSLKAIFADNYAFKSWTDIHNALSSRGQTYEKILGPSGLAIPSDIVATRKEFASQTGSKKIDVSERKDLLGYTAWYRRGGNTKDARGYSSTAYGHTNVLDGFIKEIPDKEQTKEWMIKNLQNDQENLKTITQAINKSLTGKGITLTTDNLIDILKYKQIPIDNTNKILRINVKWYFYLLAECANESVGLSLDGDATIITTKPDETTKYSSPETTTITPTKETSSVLDISKSTKTIDLDVKGKKGNLNIVGQGSVKVGGWKENGGQGNEENTGGQGGIEETETDSGNQGTTELG